jgi:hypothetical protein
MLVLLPVIQARSLSLLRMQPATSTVQPRSHSLLSLYQKVRHKVCRTLWQDATYDILAYVILCGRPYVDDITLCRTLWQALRRRVHPARMYVTLAGEGNFYYVRMSYRESTKYVQTSPKIPNNYYYVALIVKSSTVGYN